MPTSSSVMEWYRASQSTTSSTNGNASTEAVPVAWWAPSRMAITISGGSDCATLGIRSQGTMKPPIKARAKVAKIA